MITQASPPNGNIPRNRLVFAAENYHDPSLGAPPAIVARPSDMLYTGFFETELGEQLVVSIDRDAKAGVLRSGDVGWSTEIVIEDNSIRGDHVLSLEEYSWLAACWLAATGQALTKPPVLMMQDSVKRVQAGGYTGQSDKH